MGISYGINSHRIKPGDINQVIFTNGVVNSNGADSSGGFFIQFQFDSPGCGQPDSSIRVELKDPIPWTKITYEVYNVGSASCWSYNQGSFAGNLLGFDVNQDRLFNCVNSFELPQYAKKMTACDNNSDNFLHGSYKTGSFNSFFVTRRRNSPSTLAQIAHQRSCNSTGASSYVIIRNIFVY